MTEDEAHAEHLLKQAKATMELGFAIDVVTKEEDAGRWPDLTRLEERRPDILGAIVWMLSRDVPARSICDALKVSPCTVNRVRHDAKWKEAVVSKKQSIAEMIDTILLLKLQDVLDEARAGNLPSAFDTKLLFDIRQLLTGGATARVEVTASDAEREALEFFQQARQSQQTLTPAGMVLEAEIIPAKGALLAPAVPPLAQPQPGDYKTPEDRT